MSGIKKFRKWLGYVLAVCLVGVGAYSLYYFSEPRPVPFEELKPIANSLKPLIAQLENYHDVHGEYPASLAAIGLPETLDVYGSPTEIRYSSNFELNQMDPKIGGNVTSNGMSLGLHINSANVLLYEHTSKLKGWRLLTGNYISANPLDL